MKLRLVKIGNSYTVRIPHKIAEPFIAGGEIDIRFPEDVPPENKKDLINKTPIEETKWDRMIKKYE